MLKFIKEYQTILSALIAIIPIWVGFIIRKQENQKTLLRRIYYSLVYFIDDYLKVIIQLEDFKVRLINSIKLSEETGGIFKTNTCPVIKLKIDNFYNTYKKSLYIPNQLISIKSIADWSNASISNLLNHYSESQREYIYLELEKLDKDSYRKIKDKYISENKSLVLTLDEIISDMKYNKLKDICKLKSYIEKVINERFTIFKLEFLPNFLIFRSNKIDKSVIIESALSNSIETEFKNGLAYINNHNSSHSK